MTDLRQLLQPALAGLCMVVLGGCDSADLKVASGGPAASDTGPTGTAEDADGDGHDASIDCDDSDPEVHPGAAERCNERDDDCDGEVDEDLALVSSFADEDGDGHGDLTTATTGCAVPEGRVGVDGDCDDADPEIHPFALEPCGGGDRNCDGVAPDACGSCLEVLEAQPSAPTGVYEIRLETEGDVAVWCDMDTDGGGWTLIQRTVWDWAETGALMTGYESWYRDTIGLPDDGRAFRLAGRAWGELARSQELLVEVVARQSDEAGSCAPLHYRGTGGRMLVSSHAAHLTGLEADVALISGETLSTPDAGPSASCTADDGVPWFYGGCCATCPSYRGSYWSDSAHPMVSYADAVPDLAGNTTAEQCDEGPLRSAGDGGFIGVDVLGVSLR